MAQLGISYEYKIGVKREITNALRDAVENWPDDKLRGQIQVVNEWPTKEIHYPMILVTFQEQEIKNVGIGHREIAYDDDESPYTLLHWFFRGVLRFEIFAETPVDRDYVAVGLLNAIAFGKDIPGFQKFWSELYDNDFIALQINTEHITPSGDSVADVPWGNPDEHIFTTAYSVELIGEFFSNPYTGGLVQISEVIAYPYKKDQPIPQGSQATLGNPGDADYKDDRTVPWLP